MALLRPSSGIAGPGGQDRQQHIVVLLDVEVNYGLSKANVSQPAGGSSTAAPGGAPSSSTAPTVEPEWVIEGLARLSMLLGQLQLGCQTSFSFRWFSSKSTFCSDAKELPKGRASQAAGDEDGELLLCVRCNRRAQNVCLLAASCCTAIISTIVACILLPAFMQI